MAEHIIKVYTGDVRGAGTDANVHIILFGDKDSSQLTQLNKSLDHRDPFERGKVSDMVLTFQLWLRSYVHFPGISPV